MSTTPSRINVRLTPELRRRLIAVCKATGLDEPTALRALVEAFCERVEHEGGVWLPLQVMPKAQGTPKIPTPTFPITAAPVPSRASSLNEEPPARPVVPVAAPRITKTRAVLKRMVAKEKKKS